MTIPSHRMKRYTLLNLPGKVLAGLVILGGVRAASETPYEIRLDSRMRLEEARQEGKEDAQNTSLRLRPALTTGDWMGLQAEIEGEFTQVLDRASYNAAGVHGNTNRTVIADPETTELNQAWLSYSRTDMNLKVGRQRMVYDNQRWIGDVGWRQNQQTYDAAAIHLSPISSITLSYAHIARVLRIFGDEAPHAGGNAGELDSDSHLVHGRFSIPDLFTGSIYYYHLRLDDAVPVMRGSDTLGFRVQSEKQLKPSLWLDLEADLAIQEGAGKHPASYQATYSMLAATLRVAPLSLGVGWESLGSDSYGRGEDGTVEFAAIQSPLATLHKFNGYADVFLVTPERGLEDRYATLGYTFSEEGLLGLPIHVGVTWHSFHTDKGDLDLGTELDGVVAVNLPFPQIPGKIKALAKVADYHAPTDGKDLERFILEINYSLTF